MHITHMHTQPPSSSETPLKGLPQGVADIPREFAAFIGPAIKQKTVAHFQVQISLLSFLPNWDPKSTRFFI